MKPCFLILMLITSLCCGCGVWQNAQSRTGGACYGKNFGQLLQATNLKDVFNEVATGLCAAPKGIAKACGEGGDSYQRKTVLVTDLVDLQTFVPNSQGLLMGELMRGSLNDVCCYKIIQAEFGKFFDLSEKGLVVLTRRAEDIKSDAYPRPEVIAGTYSFLNNKIVIFVRSIDTSTGSISRMVTREIDYDCYGDPVKYTVK